MLTPAAAERGDTYVVLETTHKKRSRADEDTYRDFLLERVATAYLGVLPGRLSQKEACRQVPALQRWQCARSIYRLIEEAHVMALSMRACQRNGRGIVQLPSQRALQFRAVDERAAGVATPAATAHAVALPERMPAKLLLELLMPGGESAPEGRQGQALAWRDLLVSAAAEIDVMHDGMPGFEGALQTPRAVGFKRVLQEWDGSPGCGAERLVEFYAAVGAMTLLHRKYLSPTAYDEMATLVQGCVLFDIHGRELHPTAFADGLMARIEDAVCVCV